MADETTENPPAPPVPNVNHNNGAAGDVVLLGNSYADEAAATADGAAAAGENPATNDASSASAMEVEESVPQAGESGFVSTP